MDIEKEQLIKESNEFWESVFSEDYPFNKENAYKELSDFYFILEQVPKVYCAVTGDRLSKPMYPAKIVIEAYEEDLNKICNDRLKEEMQYILEDIEECENKDEIMELIKNRIDE